MFHEVGSQEFPKPFGLLKYTHYLDFIIYFYCLMINSFLFLLELEAYHFCYWLAFWGLIQAMINLMNILSVFYKNKQHTLFGGPDSKILCKSKRRLPTHVHTHIKGFWTQGNGSFKIEITDRSACKYKSNKFGVPKSNHLWVLFIHTDGRSDNVNADK